VTATQAALYGAIGALLPDVIRIIKDRHNVQLPPYLKSLNFYLGLLFAVALGAAVAWLLAPSDVKAALAYGFGAPEIITRMLSKAPSPAGAAAAASVGPRSVRRWWAV
jgi:purine-cytosine permease-like protein